MSFTEMTGERGQFKQQPCGSTRDHVCRGWFIGNRKNMLQKWTLGGDERKRKFQSPLPSNHCHFSSVPTFVFLFSSLRTDCVHINFPSSFLKLQLNMALPFWEFSLKTSTCIFSLSTRKRERKKKKHEEEKGRFWLYIQFSAFKKRYSCLECHSFEFLLWGLHSITRFGGEGPPENL